MPGHGARQVLGADIEAAFDNLSHSALLERVRASPVAVGHASAR